MKVKSYLIILLGLIMLSFNASAATLTETECKSRPIIRGNLQIEQYVTGPYPEIDLSYYGVYKGCVYLGDNAVRPDGSSGFVWFPQYPFIPGESKPGRKPPEETQKPEPVKPDTQNKGEGTGTGLDNIGSGSGGKGDSGSDTSGTAELGDTYNGTGSSSDYSSDNTTPVPEPTSKPERIPDLTPSPKPPITPLPEPSTTNLNSEGVAAYQLLNQYDECIRQSENMPSDAAYNLVIVGCNSLVEQMRNSLEPNKLYSLSGDAVPSEFLLKTEHGAVISCTPNPDPVPYYYHAPSPSEAYHSVLGRYILTKDPIKPTPTGGHYLNMPYFTPNNSGDVACSDAYSAFLSSGDANKNDDNSGADVASGADGKPTAPSVVNPTVDKGQGSSNISSDFTPPNPATGDNADVVNAINRFHHDANIKSDGLSNQIKGNQSELLNKLDSNNKELIDTIKNNNGNDNKDIIDAMNNNHQELIESLNKESSIDTSGLNNTFNQGTSDYESGLTSAIDGILGSLDKYAPNLKGFGLPEGFYSGEGHCVPLDMSFDFTLPYFNYSAPVDISTKKMCEFYDGYPRELLKLLIYVLTGFVLFSLVKRALE